MFRTVLAISLLALPHLAFSAGPAPGKPRLAVMGIQGPDFEESEVAALEEQVAQVASDLTTMDIVGASDLRAMLDIAQMQQLTGCEEASCMTEFGNVLAVQQMISGSVRKVGETFAVNLKLLDLVNGRVLKRASRQVEAKRELLFEAVRQSVSILFGIVGRIRIWGQPAGAEIFLDGRLMGTTPIEAITVRSPGDHEVAILGPNVTPWTTRVTVEAGADTRLWAGNRNLADLRDEAASGRRSAWLTGAGAVASALTAGALYALAVRNDRRLDTIDRRTASQAELDAITDKTLGFVLGASGFGVVALSLGGVSFYFGTNNEAASILAEQPAERQTAP